MATIDQTFLREHRPHEFTVFSSDLGFPAYDPYPETLVVPGLGNGEPFYPVRHQVRNGVDVANSCAMRYRQNLGCVEIVIYND